MGSEYDNSRPSEYLQYLDAYNLYGWSVSQMLLVGEFRWVRFDSSRPLDVVDYLSGIRDRGYLLEVDIKYPKDLHNSHNDWPFLCERFKVNGVQKLVPNLYDKKNHVVHIRTLKQALDQGLVLEKIHKIIGFKQSDGMSRYIDFNTRLRTMASNDFEKDFYKLMINSVFRKTMENIRPHRNIKLVNNREDYLRTVMKPNFKSGVLLGEDLISCEMGKTKIKMNKPVYLGQAILDLSKLVMYEFHYGYRKRKYNEDKLKLLYMDTDSLVYSIRTENFYVDIAADVEERFDTNGYISDRPLPVAKNKKVIGLMKDELGGKIMR